MTFLRTERRRGFQPPWHTVFVYECDHCGELHYIRYTGAPGGFVCGIEKDGVTCMAVIKL